MQQKEENDLKENLEEIDKKISNCIRLKEEEMRKISQNAKNTIARISKVRSEKELIDFNNRYGSLNKYVSRKREIEKKLKAKKKDAQEMKEHLAEKQKEKAIMMLGRQTALKNQWSARMRELNQGLKQKFDNDRKRELEMQNHGATLKEINNLRQEDTRENRKL